MLKKCKQYIDLENELKDNVEEKVGVRCTVGVRFIDCYWQLFEEDSSKEFRLLISQFPFKPISKNVEENKKYYDENHPVFSVGYTGNPFGKSITVEKDYVLVAIRQDSKDWESISPKEVKILRTSLEIK